MDRIVFSWELFCPDGFGDSWNGMLRKWWFLGMWGTPSYIISSITFEWTFLFLGMEKFVRSGRRLFLSGGFYCSGKFVDFGKGMWYYVSLRRRKRNG